MGSAQMLTVRRRRMSSPPASSATPPMTANSSTSAPVKGKLDVPLVVLSLVPAADPVLGRLAVPAAVPAVVWLPETVGGMIGQFGGVLIDGWTVGLVVVQPVPAAPASPGTTTTDATASPVPITNRRAQIIVCLPSTGDPACPSLETEQPLGVTILPAVV
jgi:hypothetical protein